MIKLCTGDILQAQTEAIVIPVNTVGVMGRGLAKQFKDKYPYAYNVYLGYCKLKKLKPGGIVIANSQNGYYAIMMATKDHWRQPSKMEWIIEGLKNLNNHINNPHRVGPLKSIAIPKIGCGLGGLKWDIVKPLIFAAIGTSKCEVSIYE